MSIANYSPVPTTEPEPAAVDAHDVGFWGEVAARAPKTWRTACYVCLAAAVLGIPSDLQTIARDQLPLVLGLRLSFLAYFLINLIVAYRNPDFVRRYHQWLMAIVLYIVGIPIAIMGAIAADSTNLYMMGIIEAEFAVATFFIIRTVHIVAGVLVASIAYLAGQVLLVDNIASSELTNITVTLVIFATLSIFAHRRILQSKRSDFQQRKALEASKARVTGILSSISDAFFAFDNDWRFTYFNDAAKRFLPQLNRSAETLRGRRIWDEFPNLVDHSELYHKVLQAKAESEPVYFEEYYPRLKAHMEVRAYPSDHGMSLYFHDATDRRLTENAQKLREISQKQAVAREEERKRISQEVHDQLGQNMTVLKMDLGWLQRHAPAAAPEMHERLDIMSDIVDQTIVAIRDVAENLRPGILDDFGLGAAIESLVETIHERTRINCQCLIEPEDLRIDPGRSIAVFRIAQEAVTNAVRHAGPSRIDVRLEAFDDYIRLEVRDDGVGIASEHQPRSRSGLGVAGMYERALQYESELQIRPLPLRGTIVVLEMPLVSNVEPLTA